MDLLIENFFNIKIMSDAFPFLIRGLKTTLLLCVIVIPLGLIGGLLVALLTNIKIKIIYYTLIFVKSATRRPPIRPKGITITQSKSVVFKPRTKKGKASDIILILKKFSMSKSIIFDSRKIEFQSIDQGKRRVQKAIHMQ